MYELLTTEQMADADRRAVAAGLPSLTLMENAGSAVADVAAQMLAPGAAVIILCGPGNNGGDGYVAARLLKNRGFAVTVSSLVPIETLTGDAREMARLSNCEPVLFIPDSIDGNSLVIDAVFGSGLSRPLPPLVEDIIERVQRLGIPVLAVDIPSGIDGNTGARLGAAFRATKTVTFVRMKLGHVLYPGRDHCGATLVSDIGIGSDIIAELEVHAAHNSRPALFSARRLSGPQCHKYTRGHALVVSGGPLQSGAARLAARGALRLGAGLVTICGPSSACAVHAAHVTAIMLAPCHGAKDLSEILSDVRKTAVLVGPGGGVGAEIIAIVEAALASQAAVVLDADALTSYAQMRSATDQAVAFGFTGRASGTFVVPDDLFRAIAAKSAGSVVLTPHDGEFKRVFGELPGSKVDRARAAANRSHAIIVLKGPDTVIAHPDGRVVINSNAPPTLATAGSGDVLAGFITALLAQGVNAFEAACAAVWVHGECANRFGPGLIAEDLPDMVPHVIRDLNDDGAI